MEVARPRFAHGRTSKCPSKISSSENDKEREKALFLHFSQKRDATLFTVDAVKGVETDYIQ